VSRKPGPLQPRFLLLGAPIFALSLLAGCHSPFVEATIDNQGSAALHMIEVDYPSASFGVGNLSGKSQFHYRFKIQGSGPLKLEFTDPQGKVRNLEGPVLNQGQEGRIVITIDGAQQVTWQPSLTDSK
jgi:hypothetical protein